MIRLAKERDFASLWQVYLEAREFMKQTGNPNQWGDFSPTQEMLHKDIEEQKLYLVERNAGICGVFFFDIAPDPWYAVIDGGTWRDDSPYGVLHRVAAKTAERGVFKECLEFALSQISHLRIDTHEDNKVMQHILQKNGFSHCGTIYMDNGEPRLAYERV